MMNCDIIVTWPTSCDYPLWRKFLRDNRFRFRRVFIMMMTAHHGRDYTSFLREAMAHDDVTIVDNADYQAYGDWRNLAVNAALDRSTSEWVWFTEQDFVVIDPAEFFAEVEERMALSEVLYFMEGERVHPACLFVERRAIEETRRDFSIVPDVSDHFYKFAEDLSLHEADPVIGDFYHMNGLTHNYHLVATDQNEHIYQLEAFKMYNKQALAADIEQDPEFYELMWKVDQL